MQAKFSVVSVFIVLLSIACSSGLNDEQISELIRLEVGAEVSRVIEQSAGLKGPEGDKDPQGLRGEPGPAGPAGVAGEIEGDLLVIDANLIQLRDAFLDLRSNVERDLARIESDLLELLESTLTLEAQALDEDDFVKLRNTSGATTIDLAALDRCLDRLDGEVFDLQLFANYGGVVPVYTSGRNCFIVVSN